MKKCILFQYIHSFYLTDTKLSLRLSLAEEFFNPFAVCVILEGFHGLEGVKQKPWKETSPQAAKAVKGSQGGTNCWREVVVVASQVADEPEEIGH